ncbi:MAG: flagellar hook-length control protein FliK [Proteobacteria bacterium]|nr:flagellar hook-length control protein FliK [Cystobacterineae bacterium]MCL2258324.1 flagellar hook-length control protein FliK [Cystobacterineae bacterium]MCL2315349.1 flagellar hook-length control protein FliK [Pseudomonadota bacterium]
MATETEKQPEVLALGPELRLIDRRAFVGFPSMEFAPGIHILDFALQIPEMSFPLNITGGVARFQKKKLHFGYLTLQIDAQVVLRRLQELLPLLSGIKGFSLDFRNGFIEGQGWLNAVPFTLKIAFDGDGETLAVYFYDFRLYAYAAMPVPRLAVQLVEAIEASGMLPEVCLQGVHGFTTRILPGLVERAAVSRGYRIPSLEMARVAEASVDARGIRLKFSAGGMPPLVLPDESLLLNLEGARAFADAERLLAGGRLDEARNAYLKLGDAMEAHPFAVERLLSLMAAETQAHEFALDLTQSLLRRRPQSATALWTEAVIHEKRGEVVQAGECFLKLCQLARKNGEETSAFFAATAAVRLCKEQAPQVAVAALHEALGVRPDHVPSLRALAESCDIAEDRAGAIRAYRRLAALSRDSVEVAHAHTHLARLCAMSSEELAGARLHCEAALRILPDHPEALLRLGQLCFQGDEHLRALKTLDRLRQVALLRHDIPLVGEANIWAGKVWEEGLKQPENALLRYREAVSLLPNSAQALLSQGRVAEVLGHFPEALTAYQQAIELVGPSPQLKENRRMASHAHRALAHLYQARMENPGLAQTHLEAALFLEPSDVSLLEELLPKLRNAGKLAELADLCERAVSFVSAPQKRTELLLEAAELYRGPLSNPERALKLLLTAFDMMPTHRPILEALLSLAEAMQNSALVCKVLRNLVLQEADTRKKVLLHRRLAISAKVAGDFPLAIASLNAVLQEEPEDVVLLGELSHLLRLQHDMSALVVVLEKRGDIAFRQGDKSMATQAFRELSSVFEAKLGRKKEALEVLQKVAFWTKEPGSLSELVELAWRCERADVAKEALETWLALPSSANKPEQIAKIRAQLGKAYEGLGDKEAAKQCYAEAFVYRRLDDELASKLEAMLRNQASYVELAEFWNQRAQALGGAGRIREASLFYFQSAQQLLDLSQSVLAMQRLQAAVEVAPNSPEAAYALEQMARMAQGSGETQEAARLWAECAACTTEPTRAAESYWAAAQLKVGEPEEIELLTKAIACNGLLLAARLRRSLLEQKVEPAVVLEDCEILLGATEQERAFLAIDRIGVARRAAFCAHALSQSKRAAELVEICLPYVSQDVELLRMAVSLFQVTGNVSAEVECLEKLWPLVSQEESKVVRRKYIEVSLSLGVKASIVELLRQAFFEEAEDAWAPQLLWRYARDEAADSEKILWLEALIRCSFGEQKASWFWERANLYTAMGDFAKTKEDLRQVSALLVSPPEKLWVQLAGIECELGAFGEELACWKRVVDAGMTDSVVLQKAADRVVVLAQMPQAVWNMQAWELALNLPISEALRSQAWMCLARKKAEEGDVVAAEEAFAQAAQQGPNVLRVEALLARAQSLEARNMLVEAGQAFDAVLALSPSNKTAMDGYKRCLKEVGDFENLSEVLSTEALRAPKAQAALLYEELAHIYLDKLSWPTPGEAALRRAIVLGNSSQALRVTLAELLAQKNEFQEAIGFLEAAAKTASPTQAANLLRYAAKWAQKLGDDGRELHLLREAQKLHSAEGEELSRFAQLLYFKGAVGEALPVVRQWAHALDASAFPEESQKAKLYLADVLETAGELEEARLVLEGILASSPQCLPALNKMVALLAAGKTEAGMVFWCKHFERQAMGESFLGQTLAFARQAFVEFQNASLGESLFLLAEKTAEDIRGLQEEHVALLRPLNQPEFAARHLNKLALLRLGAGDIQGALEAWEEEIGAQEALGNTHEVLRTLQAMAELCGGEGRNQEAAKIYIRQARLVIEKQEAWQGALGYLEAAWRHSAQWEVADFGRKTAQRVEQAEAKVLWQLRCIESAPEKEEKAKSLVALADIYQGLWDFDKQQETLKAALELHPRFELAEQRLLVLWESQNRQEEAAIYFETLAVSLVGGERASLLMRAAEIWEGKPGYEAQAVSALLAARIAAPEDVDLLLCIADKLHKLGCYNEAAEFDESLLKQSPLHSVFERHCEFLRGRGEWLSLANLLVRRAKVEPSEQGLVRFLEAADIFEQLAEGQEAARCEQLAFEIHPEDDRAFLRLKKRFEQNPLKLSTLLAERAEHSEEREALSLLRERALVLMKAEDWVGAAFAYDGLLERVPEDLESLRARAELAFRSGGAQAAKPFDMRLLRIEDSGLSAQEQAGLWFRISQAAMEGEGFVEAENALKRVWQLAPESHFGKAALSGLDAVYVQRGDLENLYGVRLQAAQMAQGEEAFTLLEVASKMEGLKDKGLAALQLLFGLAPTDEGVFNRIVAVLSEMGVLEEELRLRERYAHAVGGGKGAQALVDAAVLLKDDWGRSLSLLDKALSLDSRSLAALQAKAQASRRNKDWASLGEVLPIWTQHSPKEWLPEIYQTWMELAEGREHQGDMEGAIEAFEFLSAKAEEVFSLKALDGLERIWKEQGNLRGLSQILLKRAAKTTGEAASKLLLEAAQGFQNSGAFEEALNAASASLVLRPTTKGWLLVAQVNRSLRRFLEAANAWKSAAEMVSGDLRARWWLHAADAMEQSGDLDGAAQLLSQTRKEFPNMLPDGLWTQRMLRLATAFFESNCFRQASEIVSQFPDHPEIQKLRVQLNFENFSAVEPAQPTEEAEFDGEKTQFIKMQPIGGGITPQPMENELAQFMEDELTQSFSDEFMQSIEDELAQPVADELAQTVRDEPIQPIVSESTQFIAGKLSNALANAELTLVFEYGWKFLEIGEKPPLVLTKSLLDFCERTSLPEMKDLWVAAQLRLLRESWAEAETWRALSFRFREREEGKFSSWAHELASVLSSSVEPSAMLLGAIKLPIQYNAVLPPPDDAVLLTESSLPRIYQALRNVVLQLGGQELVLVMDAKGGFEAWLATGNVLVFGQEALACFGLAELGYLTALALVLSGRCDLSIESETWLLSVQEAFVAYPSVMAAGRVLAALEGENTKFASREPGERLKTSAAFKGIVDHILNVLWQWALSQRSIV